MAPVRYGRGSGRRTEAVVVAQVRLAGYLQQAAIVTFALGVIASVLGNNFVATALFVIAIAGFLATIVLQTRR